MISFYVYTVKGGVRICEKEPELSRLTGPLANHMFPMTQEGQQPPISIILLKFNGKVSALNIFALKETQELLYITI